MIIRCHFFLRFFLRIFANIHLNSQSCEDDIEEIEEDELKLSLTGFSDRFDFRFCPVFRFFVSGSVSGFAKVFISGFIRVFLLFG